MEKSMNTAFWMGRNWMELGGDVVLEYEKR